MSNLPSGIAKLKKVRITIPPNLECDSHTTTEVFDFLERNSGLTEEFIYNNTSPVSNQLLPVYSASYKPIGYLPFDTVKNGKPLKVCEGNVIIIFRQGYAGKMYIPDEDRFFASEHTIPIRVKESFQSRVNINWFVKYYEPEVLRYVTGKADSGNFSELAFKKIPLLLPPRCWQDECAALYDQMDKKLKDLEMTLAELSVDTSQEAQF
jgi:restriction endonuclease S subunit